MLDQQDIIILKNMMVTVLDEKLDNRLAKVDEKLAQTEASILAKVDEKLDKRLAQTEASILAKVDEKLDKRLAQTEASILAKVDEKLDKRLAQTEASILAKVDEKLVQTEASILAKVDEKLDKRLAQTEASILAKVNEKLTKSENLILDELERTRTILEEKISKVQKNVDDMNQYYRITKIENDNTAIFLKRVDELEIRVEKLEAEQQNRKEYMDDAASLMAAQG